LAFSLGIDTGGTYTDAVLFYAGRGVVAKAKSLTTRHDLAIGIAGAVEGVLAAASVTPDQIELVSLSTTLATNALVEGRGGRVGLVFIGFDDDDANRSGLLTALDGDPLIRVSGGHNSHGDQRSALDEVVLSQRVLDVAESVSGFAVSAHFGTRNPSHEQRARDLIVALTGLPVTCGHELTAKLDGPRRALTSVLNARLISLIADLITAAQQIMNLHGIEAPLLVVRGDGALMSAAVAKTRPIETILSGPAASVVGAAYLTGVDDAVIADIGGTTTDVAVIWGGAPKLDQAGATVGGWRTMVEAVAMTTIGLGGDSEVVVDIRSLAPTLQLGPRRVIPLCLAHQLHPQAVAAHLDRQLLADMPDDHDGRFAFAVGDERAANVNLTAEEIELLLRIRSGVSSLDRLGRGRGAAARLDTLVRRGLVLLAGFTPTDAAQVLGLDQRFDESVSAQGAELMARKRTALGRPVAVDGVALSEWTIATLRRRSAETLLDVAFEIDGLGSGASSSAPLSRHPLVAAAIEGRSGLVQVSAALSVPVIGLGASAGLHYPAVAEMLRAKWIVPEHADVANAVGAVVGQVRVLADIYVSQPVRDRYRVHHPEAPSDTSILADAMSAAHSLARAQAHALAVAAGADAVQVSTSEKVTVAQLEGEEYFVEATVTAVATGRPAVAK
jgi:N-methylhydantoinase A/oxoprolinase/acetone carboxylase beta subunit